MKPLLNILLIVLFPVCTLFAQDCHSRSSAKGGGVKAKKINMEEVKKANRYNPFEDHSSPFNTKKDSTSLRFGFGLNTIVGMNTGQSRLGTNLSWFNNNPASVFEIAGLVGKQHRFVLGGSMAFRRLGSFSISREYRPEDYLPTSKIGGTHALTVTLHEKVRMFTTLLYSEYRLHDFGGGVQAFVRGEFGFTRFSANMTETYKSTCGCEKYPHSEVEAYTSFDAGMGVGLRWENRFLGFKTFVIFRNQTKVGLKQEDSYQNYAPVFNAVNYNFKGDPRPNRFSIQTTPAENRHTYGFVYIQFTLYYILGK